MTSTPQLRVLFFDTFGTTVVQLTPVADKLWKAAQEALESNESSVSNEVRTRAANMTYEQWFEFADEWNREENTFRRDLKAKTGNVDWRIVDQLRIKALPRLLAQRGLIILHGDDSTSDSELQIGKGSLFNESQLKHLGTIWHRLPPWPDSCPGLHLLNKKFATVALSNTYTELLQQLVAYSNLPFTQIYSSDMFQSYKSNPKVYLGAAEKMGVKPEECGLVAAHLSDLKGAKACGFHTIYVERPLEEKNPNLRDEGIPDLVIKEDENGFITLAERLGIYVE